MVKIFLQLIMLIYAMKKVSLQSTEEYDENSLPEDILLHGTYKAPQIIESRGYPVEVHHILTDDGYILEMHRIPGPRKSYRNFDWEAAPGRGRAVYIQHCVLCNSGDFILNDPEEALAYVLADAGFDVWLGNYRGNYYSRKHMYLSPEEKNFWKFSFMEMAHYDIPAMIDYILLITRLEYISYIGHSMGTTGFFAALSMEPSLNSKIDMMVAMAPVTFMDHMRGPFRHMLNFAKKSYYILEKLGGAEVSRRTRTQELLAKTFCKPKSIVSQICQGFIPAFTGLNLGYIDKQYLPVVLSHLPSGTSIRTLAHLGQLIGPGEFRMFDFGHKKNKEYYGQEDPPLFNLNHVKVPVGLFWSENDWVAAPQDVEHLSRVLPNVVYNYKVPQEDFNHFDFLFSETAREVLYDPILYFLTAS